MNTAIYHVDFQALVDLNEDLSGRRSYEEPVGESVSFSEALGAGRQMSVEVAESLSNAIPDVIQAGDEYALALQRQRDDLLEPVP